VAPRPVWKCPAKLMETLPRSRRATTSLHLAAGLAPA